MKVLFKGSVPKNQNFPKENEDRVKVCLKQQRAALSDGASESFDSKTWAELLVNHFTKYSSLSSQQLEKLIGKYNRKFTLSSLSWSQQISFDKGSFSTILALKYLPKRKVLKSLVIGDSVIVLIEEGKFKDSFLYTHSKEFKKSPQLISTCAKDNIFFTDSSDSLRNHSKSWSLSNFSSPIVLCMTDALAEWAFHEAEEGQERWRDLASIKSDSHFRDLIMKERQLKKMRVDDATLLTLSFTDC